ncbi:PaREP1 family protein [Stygiolobus azoricus]|uniref:Uncharacterized protein n=1 Tax=Stygiolobus azoricus TaxID=41675 RepID=A0A650CQ89_9CREN|nr:PaREP1 family protein [Stygiolobus azoricus]QGR19822.1 hypothetical protein D1868_07415 [Stygiolobus azoricus]
MLNLGTLADIYLKEGDEFLNKNDLVQASEKYYKATEKVTKILSNKNNIKVLSEVKNFIDGDQSFYLKRR